MNLKKILILFFLNFFLQISLVTAFNCTSDEDCILCRHECVHKSEIKEGISCEPLTYVYECKCINGKCEKQQIFVNYSYPNLIIEYRDNFRYMYLYRKSLETLLDSDQELAIWAMTYLPGYAGRYWKDYEKKILTVFVTQDYTKEEVLNAMKKDPYLFGFQAFLPEENIELKKVKYSWIDLVYWLKPFNDTEQLKKISQIYGIKGFISSDIDESSNKIRIRVADETAKQQIENILKRAGIPSNAFMVEIGPPITPAGKSTKNNQHLKFIILSVCVFFIVVIILLKLPFKTFYKIILIIFTGILLVFLNYYFFLSLRPVIDYITPSQAKFGDEIMIYGNGFTYYNIIKFVNPQNEKVIGYTGLVKSGDGITLKFKVPDVLGTCKSVDPKAICLVRGIALKPGTYKIAVINEYNLESNYKDFTILS